MTWQVSLALEISKQIVTKSPIICDQLRLWVSHQEHVGGEGGLAAAPFFCLSERSHWDYFNNSHAGAKASNMS